ncbi:hypothetical protein [Bacillus thuringiensis]|uniref:hypothetical protein n=1 Tax=Bacillus thuringiensis TaxID=1428 RepID=UPI0033369F5C
MNQNCNNNGYEILDSNDMYRQLRYPFAQAPGSKCQKLNDKDGIYPIVGSAYTEFRNVVDLGLSVRTALGILQSILSVGFPWLGRAAGLINIVFGFIWGTVAGQSTWERFMNAVEYLIDQKITQAVRSTALADLEGIQNALELLHKRYEAQLLQI